MTIAVKKMLIGVAIGVALVVMPGVLPASASVINEDERAAPQNTTQTESTQSDTQWPLIKDAEKNMLATDVYQEMDQRLQQAWNQHIQAVKSQWVDASVSNATQWVTYSEDLRIRRRVDFQKNQIDITLPAVYSESTIDYPGTGKLVESQLNVVLSATIRQALTEDPVYRTVWPDMARYVPVSFTNELVLSELFPQGKPSEPMVARLSRRLMARAEIAFYHKTVSASIRIPIKLGERLTYSIPLPDDRLVRKARKYRSHILSIAEQFDIPSDLVYAIIHTESHFNPLARSPIPAYGLMQIVPRTAGRDASRVLYDDARLFSPAFLYNPENNITVGAAYLRLLYFHYLKGIRDPKSRLYCSIAAYNAGVVTVARVFNGVASMDEAATDINALSSQQVLARLLESLPSKETRDYLKKVLALKSLYSQI